MRHILDHYFLWLASSLPLLIKGLSLTLQVFFCSSCLSMLVGLCMGVCSCDRLKIPLLSQAVKFMTFVLRGVPFYVQLLIVYFVLPELLGFNLDPFAASVIALGLCSSGYIAQLVQGAINAIPLGQWEAAFSLGYSNIRALYHIILPQMFRIILPSVNNELDALLKSTSVISTIGMLELTRIGMNLVSRDMEPVPIYLTIAAIYLLFSALLHTVSKKLEKRLMYVKSN